MFKKGVKCTYLPKNLELVRLQRVRPGGWGCHWTLYYQVIQGKNCCRGWIGKEVRGPIHGKDMLLFEDGGWEEFPLEYLQLTE